MADILMIANPATYRNRLPRNRHIKTHWLTFEKFWQNEQFAKTHDHVLWQTFHTHGKYMRLARLAHYFAVATNHRGQYLASAMVIRAGEKWLLEYLMTDPAEQERGIGSAVIDRVMREARHAQAHWVILNCDPAKNKGQLPKLYEGFGFKPAESV